MSAPRKTTTHVYLYDPLNRLVNAHSSQRFYNGTRVATEIQGECGICFFEHEAKPLAELHPDDTVTLLATDQQRSVLNGVSPVPSQPQSYGPYGNRSTMNGLLTVLGFNGERPDPITGHYLLGQGYRAFNPVLMRFNSPDNFSPFGIGSLNCYAYCKGDPVNFNDPSGHFLNSFRKALVSLAGGLLKKPPLSVSVDYAKGAVGRVSKYQNIQRAAGGIYIADEPLEGGGKSLIINGHGSEGGNLMSKGQRLDSKEFVSRLKGKGINIGGYSDVHLMICHSADGGENSLAHYINRKFSIPVTAYEGSVSTFYSPVTVVKNESKKIPWLYRSSLEVREATFLKSKQLDIRNDGSVYRSGKNGKMQILNYRPVRIGG